MLKTMPGFCPSGTFEGGQRFGLRMYVALSRGRIAMAGKARQVVWVHHLGPTRQARMAKGVHGLRRTRVLVGASSHQGSGVGTRS
jgi:hypothetical protein